MINQSGSGKPLTEKPRMYNPTSILPIAPMQSRFASVAQNEEENRVELNINTIKSGVELPGDWVKSAMEDQNTQIPCALIEHRGSSLEKEHIDALIARNDTDIDRELVASRPKALSDEKGKILVEKTRDFFKIP
jgi:hypothetical protein